MHFTFHMTDFDYAHLTTLSDIMMPRVWSVLAIVNTYSRARAQQLKLKFYIQDRDWLKPVLTYIQVINSLCQEIHTTYSRRLTSFTDQGWMMDHTNVGWSATQMPDTISKITYSVFYSHPLFTYPLEVHTHFITTPGTVTEKPDHSWYTINMFLRRGNNAWLRFSPVPHFPSHHQAPDAVRYSIPRHRENSITSGNCEGSRERVKRWTSKTDISWGWNASLVNGVGRVS